MKQFKWSDFIHKHYWMHLIFWLIYSIYLFVNPALYKWGVMPVVYMAIAFFLTYGGSYLFTVKYIAPQLFIKKRIGRGLLLLLLSASAQQILFAPVSNYFLPFNEPFLEWFLYNLPFSYIMLLLASGVSVFTDYLYIVSRVQKLEITKVQQEISSLKSQIKPHFFFNNLNSLYSLARSKSDKTEIAILQLSDQMRYLIEMSQREFVLLSEEVKFLQSYIEMEKLRLNDDAVCAFNVSPNQYENYKLPPLLLLPFVENAFKHGAELNINKVDIHFYLTVQDGFLFFEVNNAVSPAKPTNTTGTGLNNIKKRLDLIFQKDYQLDISEADGRYIVKLKLNLA